MVHGSGGGHHHGSTSSSSHSRSFAATAGHSTRTHHPTTSHHHQQQHRHGRNSQDVPHHGQQQQTRSSTMGRQGTRTARQEEDNGISHGQGSHRGSRTTRSTTTRVAPRRHDNTTNRTRDNGISHGQGARTSARRPHEPSSHSSRRRVPPFPPPPAAAFHYHHHRGRREYHGEEHDYDYPSCSTMTGKCCRILGICLFLLIAALMGFALVGIAVLMIASCCVWNQRNSRTGWLRHMVRSTTPWAIPVGAVASGLLALSLISISQVNMPNHATTTTTAADGSIWTLWAGETQHLIVPPLIRQVTVTVVEPPASVAINNNVQAAVFALPSSCPPLTGQPVVVTQDWEMDLAPDNFQYDYFALAAGSTIDASFDQSTGKTYIYLLQGQDTLRDIQTGANVDPDHWEDIALVKRFVDANQRATDSLHYQVRGSAQDAQDVYILVYDNGSTVRPSSLDVALDIVMKTYNLNGQIPQCDNMRWWKGRRQGDACTVPLSRRQRNGCFILEAFSTGSQEKQDQKESSGDQVISLHIRTYRDWKRIGYWSVLPLALSLVFVLGQSLCCHGSDASDETDDMAEPLLPNDDDEEEEDDRPPPMAPHAVDPEPSAVIIQPSAPSMEHDASRATTTSAHASSPSIIVIPPENVEPVPLAAATTQDKQVIE